METAALAMQIVTMVINVSVMEPVGKTASEKVFLYLVAYLSSYHEKAIKATYRARLGVASHLSTTLRWGNPAKCLSQRHNK